MNKPFSVSYKYTRRRSNARWDALISYLRRINPDEVNFSDRDLSGQDFTGCNLNDVYFRDCDLTRTKFNHAEMESCDLSGSRMDNANFDSAIMDNAILKDVSGRSVIFENAEMKSCNVKLAVLPNARFSNATLDNSLFDEATLTAANFSDADLYGVNFGAADLTQAKFMNAKMRFTQLQSAILYDVESLMWMYIPTMSSRGDVLYAVENELGVRFKTGCFFGNKTAFQFRLEEDRDDDCLYYDAIKFMVKQAEKLGWKVE